MINFTNAYATVFNPSVNDRGVAMAGLTTGRKNVNQETNVTTYINSSWGNASFFGKAREKFDSLQNMDRIHITNGRIERVKGLDRDGNDIKDANGRAIYYLNIAIFDFEMAGEYNKQNTNDSNNTQDEQELPF